MGGVLHKLNWFRFINIFLSTFAQLLSISPKTTGHLLCYDATYLKFVCLCANDGFYFVKNSDNNDKLQLMCSHCPAHAIHIDKFLQILLAARANRTFAAAGTARFSCHIRDALMLFHTHSCIYFSNKKTPTNVQGLKKISLLGAFQIIRQLDRVGLLTIPTISPHSDQKRLTSCTTVDTVNLVCHVCFTDQAVLSVPCGHIFQCISCWCALIRAKYPDHGQSERVFDNIDIRSLLRLENSQGSITTVRFFGKWYCPVCRGHVCSVQQIFV